jgi:hypothetical protein
MPTISDLAPQQFAKIPFEAKRFNAIPSQIREKLTAVYNTGKEAFLLPKFYGLQIFERKEIVHQLSTQDEIQRRIAGLILQVSAEEGHDINELAQILIEQTSVAHKVALFAKHIDEVLAIQRTAESLTEDVLLVSTILKFRGATDWTVSDTLGLTEALFDAIAHYIAQDREGWGEDDEDSEGNEGAESSPSQDSANEPQPKPTANLIGSPSISRSKRRKGKR